MKVNLSGWFIYIWTVLNKYSIIYKGWASGECTNLYSSVNPFSLFTLLLINGQDTIWGATSLKFYNSSSLGDWVRKSSNDYAYEFKSY